MLKPLLATALLLALATPSHSGTVCFGPSSQTGAITTDACAPPQSEDWLGFTTSGTPCGTGPCPPTTGYYVGWAISNSMIDPNVQVGPVLGNRVYLWLVCAGMSPGEGVTRFRASVATDFNVLGIATYNGWSSNGTATELDLTAPFCATGPVLVAALDVETAVSVAPDTWGKVKARYDD